MRGRTRARARLVAAELEQRWNARLLAVRALQDELAGLAASAEPTAQAHRPGLIEEIVVRVEDDAVSLVIH